MRHRHITESKEMSAASTVGVAVATWITDQGCAWQCCKEGGGMEWKFHWILTAQNHGFR